MTHHDRIASSSSAARLQALVLGTVLSVGGFAALAGLPAVRGQTQLSTCLNHLHQIGQLSVIVSGNDARMIPHRQSVTGLTAWRGLGSFDWGGVRDRLGGFFLDR